MTGTIAASFGWMFFLEGLLRVILGQMGTEAPTWRYVLYPVTLLLLMLLRPQGSAGHRRVGLPQEALQPAAQTRRTNRLRRLPGPGNSEEADNDSEHAPDCSFG